MFISDFNPVKILKTVLAKSQWNNSRYFSQTVTSKAPDVARSIGFRALGFRVSYLSGIMGKQRLTFFMIQGLYRNYTTPKRLKVTYSTSRDSFQRFHKG